MIYYSVYLDGPPISKMSRGCPPVWDDVIIVILIATVKWDRNLREGPQIKGKMTGLSSSPPMNEVLPSFKSCPGRDIDHVLYSAILA
jgi:hypothetical protein